MSIILFYAFSIKNIRFFFISVFVLNTLNLFLNVHKSMNWRIWCNLWTKLNHWAYCQLWQKITLVKTYYSGSTCEKNPLRPMCFMKRIINRIVQKKIRNLFHWQKKIIQLFAFSKEISFKTFISFESLFFILFSLREWLCIGIPSYLSWHLHISLFSHSIQTKFFLIPICHLKCIFYNIIMRKKKSYPRSYVSNYQLSVKTLNNLKWNIYVTSEHQLLIWRTN